MKQCISSLYTSRKLMIQLGGRSCVILSLCLVSPDACEANKNVLNGTYGRVRVGKHL